MCVGQQARGVGGRGAPTSRSRSALVVSALRSLVSTWTLGRGAGTHGPRTEDTHVRGSVRRDLVPGLSSAVSRSGFPAVRGDHGHPPHGVLVAAERWRDAPTEEAAQGLSPARRGSPGRSP